MKNLVFLLFVLLLSPSVAAAPALARSAGMTPARGAKPAVRVKRPLAGYHKIWEADLPCNETVISSGELRWEAADTYRVLVTGVLDTRKLGAKYDAEFRAISEREFRVRHDHLRFGSPAWISLYSFHGAHRYVYRLDSKARKRPSRLRLSLEGIAHRYRISPARLQQDSRSTIRVSLWKKGGAAPNDRSVRWDILLIIAVLGVAGSAVVWWVYGRRGRSH